jgi:ADP-heptose:LPS heptosyltransferase
LITAVAAGENAPLLAHNPHLDDVVVLPFRGDWQGGGHLPATLRQLLHRRYDVALCLGTPALGWLAAACRIPRQEFLDFPTLWWLIPRGQSAWNRRHVVDLYATAARHLDIPPVEHRLAVRVTAAERAELQATLASLHASDSAPRVVMHAGCSSAVSKKRWPLRRFAEVAATLVERAGARIFLVGGGTEAALARELARRVGPAAVSLAGKLSVRQTLALMEACQLFVGNDSGPLHMATAVGTPVVGIYGATDPIVFGPCAPADRAMVVQPPSIEPCVHFVGGATLWQQLAGAARPCPGLAAIPAGAVIDACLHLLRATAPRAAVTPLRVGRLEPVPRLAPPRPVYGGD